MKLRLMGLRCTHLVSTKKPDTMAFFGFKPRRQDAGESSDAGMVKRKASQPLEKEDEWEKIGTDDDDLLEDLDANLDNATHENEGEEDEMLQDRRHGKEIVPNPPPERGAQPEEDWWECPICLRPQAANERQFNEHIDLCLSRQTIRDAVQADELPKETKPVPPDVNKRPKLTEKKLTEKKRGRPPSTDPKQKKLSFF